MAKLEILQVGAPVLREKCVKVENIDLNLLKLLDDMKQTLEEAQGAGLAAPQVGILRRVFIVDVEEGYFEFVNPVIVSRSGKQIGQEGCLSVPGKAGIVTRPNYAKVKAYNEDMEEFIVEGEELLARALLHEIDHLDGHLYVEKVEGDLMDVVPDDEDEMEEEE